MPGCTQVQVMSCKKKHNKAFTRSDQLLSPFLINLVSTLPVYPVSLGHLAVVLIPKEMSLQELNWLVIFFQQINIAPLYLTGLFILF